MPLQEADKIPFVRFFRQSLRTRASSIASALGCSSARFRGNLPLLLAVLLCPTPVFADGHYEYSDQGAGSCIDCHANPSVMGILDTVHAELGNPDTPAAQKACESCHGPSATHVQFPMQVENLRFGKKSATPPKVQNQMCIDCHAKGAEEAEGAWKASAHGFEDVLCSTCHSMHDPARINPAKETVSTSCSVAGCHATLMRDSAPTDFSHAVGKNIGDNGQLTCTGCHNPHGPLNSTRCLDCHSQSPAILAKQSKKARRFHEVAERQGTECIRCHKALSHPILPLQRTLQNETPRELPPPHAGGAPRASGAGG